MARAEAAAYTVWAEPGDDLAAAAPSPAPHRHLRRLVRSVVLIRPVATGMERPGAIHGRAGAFPVADALGSMSYTLLALFGLAVYGGIVGGGAAAAGIPPCGASAPWVWSLIGYSLVTGNALDDRENNRFRVEASPVVLVLAAVGSEPIVATTAARRRRRVGTVPADV